jgi:hypothetical protein
MLKWSSFGFNGNSGTVEKPQDKGKHRPARKR